jgi:holo-[acyl-carrier protein] synthase
VECGTDIIEISRITEAIEKSGSAFLDRIFTDSEKEYCELKRSAKYQSYAARFAAKEAVCKAFGTGMSGIYFNEIEVVCETETGKPGIVFHGRAKEIFEAFGNAATISISLSHSKNYATAVAIITA